MVEVWDCRRKEKMVTKKVGGDYELKFIDPATGLEKYVIWFQVKRSKELDSIFSEMKSRLERQE